MEEALKKRQAAKSWLTRATGNLEKLLEDEAVTADLLESRIREFDKRLVRQENIQSEIEVLIDLDQMEADIEKEDVFLQSKLAVLEVAKKRIISLRLRSAEQVKDSCAENKVLAGAGLPKLELPKFHGDHTEWQTFFDKFSAMIDGSKIPTINKFTYLQSLVKGEAAAAISGLSLTAQNYKTAKTILKEHFGKVMY